jgi:hypothetical protein
MERVCAMAKMVQLLIVEGMIQIAAIMAFEQS